jgi:hypothetical protein
VKTINPYAINHQYVNAFINGHKVKLAVDTGSPFTCLTYRRARDLGLNVQPIKVSWWGTGGPVAGHYGIASIQSFNLVFGAINHTSALIILPKEASLNENIDGVIGADYLALNAAIFPVGGEGILFRPGPAAHVSIADYMAKSNFTGVPMTVGHGAIWIVGYLYGEPLDLKIDSGATFSNFRMARVEIVLGKKKLHSTTLTEHGLDGRDEASFYFTPDDFTLGRFSIAHQTYLATNAASFDKDKYDGLAGFDLLGEHKAIIDFGSDMLWLH